MRKDNRVYLKQIRDSIDEVTGYIRGKSFKAFEKDSLLQDAVIRRLEVIGEAANKLSREFLQQHRDLPLLQAVAMRHKLIHDYDEIDLKIVWNTVKRDLSDLRKKLVKRLL